LNLATFLNEGAIFLGSQGQLLLPLLFSLWIALGDVRTHRIPNYLSFGTALAGLAFGLLFHGWTGLANGILGMFLGFGCLLLPYLWGGMGAGDVKALAALGAWLGPWNTFLLFCYMGMAGGLLAVGVLWWRGLLGQKLRYFWINLLNLVLSRPSGLQPPAPPTQGTEGIPYGVAIALGMVVLLCTERKSWC
jgi:prepilin peptidase CpaA